MGPELTFTGERFLPSCSGEIAYEHWHRYAFARQFVGGCHVLDAACGEGYGTALLGAVAATVVGVDIDADAIAHAAARYGITDRVRFLEGSCADLPLADAAFDVVVSFETIEHVEAEDQSRMLAEFARVLKPDGLLIIYTLKSILRDGSCEVCGAYILVTKDQLEKDDYHAVLNSYWQRALKPGCR